MAICQNGQIPDLQLSLDPTTSPVGPDASTGVDGFHDNLRNSQGTSAEGSVRKEALQSLRLSLPMQETQLCKHPFPLDSSYPFAISTFYLESVLDCSCVSSSELLCLIFVLNGGGRGMHLNDLASL